MDQIGALRRSQALFLLCSTGLFAIDGLDSNNFKLKFSTRTSDCALGSSGSALLDSFESVRLVQFFSLLG